VADGGYGDFYYAKFVGRNIFNADAEKRVDLGGNADLEAALDDAVLEAFVGVGREVQLDSLAGGVEE
jgi:hypothetical protein